MLQGSFTFGWFVSCIFQWLQKDAEFCLKSSRKPVRVHEPPCPYKDRNGSIFAVALLFGAASSFLLSWHFLENKVSHYPLADA